MPSSVCSLLVLVLAEDAFGTKISEAPLVQNPTDSYVA